MRQQFENGDIAAEPAEDRRELDSDGSASHHGYRLRDFLQMDCLIARDDALSVDRNTRHAPRLRTRRDNDVAARVQRLCLTVVNIDAAVANEARGSLNPFDLVLLEQEFDAL